MFEKEKKAFRKYVERESWTEEEIKFGKLFSALRNGFFVSIVFLAGFRAGEKAESERSDEVRKIIRRYCLSSFSSRFPLGIKYGIDGMREIGEDKQNG